MTSEGIFRALRGPRSDADREQRALGAVYEAARALEALTELRRRFEATAFFVSGELPRVPDVLARALVALSQLSGAVEKLESVAAHAANMLANKNR